MRFQPRGLDLRAKEAGDCLPFSTISSMLSGTRVGLPREDQVRTGEGEQVYRRLSRLDSVMEDMGRRSARFHVTLGEIMRSTDTSPETFLQHKNALLTHMTEFTAELDRYLPRLDQAGCDVEATGLATIVDRAAQADERPFMMYEERLEEWRRRWAALRAWFARSGQQEESRADELRSATRIAVSGVIALLRQITEAQRGGVNRVTQLRHLAEWVWAAPDDGAAHALMGAAFNARSARHLGAAHDDDEQISPRATWWDAPGVEVSVPLFRSGKPPSTGVPAPVRSNAGARRELRRVQAAERAAEREAAVQLVGVGAYDRVLDEAETRVLLKLMTKALRLVPSDRGSTVRTSQGTLHLPGFGSSSIRAVLSKALLRTSQEPRRAAPASVRTASRTSNPQQATRESTWMAGAQGRALDGGRGSGGGRFR